MSSARRTACLFFALTAALASACTSILGDYHAGEGGAGGAGTSDSTSASRSAGMSATTTGSGGFTSAGSFTSAGHMSSGGMSQTSTAGGGVGCANGIQDGSETDVDCGGDLCAPCGVGLRCGNLDSNCEFGNCRNGVCTMFQLSCGNKVQDGSETDVDCGGP